VGSSSDDSDEFGLLYSDDYDQGDSGNTGAGGSLLGGGGGSEDEDEDDGEDALDEEERRWREKEEAREGRQGGRPRKSSIKNSVCSLTESDYQVIRRKAAQVKRHQYHTLRLHR
jgi:hypothetical protein